MSTQIDSKRQTSIHSLPCTCIVGRRYPRRRLEPVAQKYNFTIGCSICHQFVQYLSPIFAIFVTIFGCFFHQHFHNHHQLSQVIIIEENDDDDDLVRYNRNWPE